MSLVPAQGVRTIAEGLRFPEGPVYREDGSVIIVEIEMGTLTRIDGNGDRSMVAKPGDGPNGLAAGPDGSLFVCNNGGFAWTEEANGILRPIAPSADYRTGRIEKVSLETGTVETLFSECDGFALRGPNDIVFDASGGFYFTDLGKNRARDRDHGGLFYANADGSVVRTIAYPMLSPNGVGLSVKGDVVYVAETETGRVWAFDIAAPGEVKKQPWPSPNGGRLVCGLDGYQRFDSLAIDSADNICVATVGSGCISVISPTGELLRQVGFDDPLVTNICFGGPDLRTAYVTLSGTGRLVAIDWPVPGAPLNFGATAGT